MLHKALFSLCCVLLCGACGNAMALHIEKRWKLLEALSRDLRFIRSRIEFEGLPLRAILDGLGDSELFPLWSGVGRSLFGKVDFADIWAQALRERRGTLLSPLKNEDIQILSEFGQSLGKAERVSMQLAQIDLTLDRLRECAKETKCEINKKSRLLRTLGTMAGFAVIIALW